MNVHKSWRTAFKLRSVAAKAFAAGMAFVVAAAISSCDSHDSAANAGASSPAGAPAATEIDTTGGEPVALSQEELAAEYGKLNGLLAEAINAAVWKQFRAQQQVNLAVSSDHLTVTATGDNPVIILPAFAAGQKFIIEAVINSPNVTSAQLFYLTPGQTKYSEDQSQVVELKAGRNVVYFKIDDPNVVDPLRFDPATGPGTYTIERMTARPLLPGSSD